MAKKTKSYPNATPVTAVEKTTLNLDPAEVVRGASSRDKAADPRYNDKVIQRAVSIFEQGQLQPAVAYRDAEGRPVLIAGHTRADAVEWLRNGFVANEKKYHNPQATLWVVVDEAAKDEETAYLNSVLENTSRDNLNPIQEGIVAETLRDKYGWPNTKIARVAFGVTNTNRIDQIDAIRKGGDDTVIQLVAGGFLGIYPAKALLSVPEGERGELLKRATDADTGRVDGSVITRYLQDKAAPPTELFGLPAEEPKAKKAPGVPKRNAKDFRILLEEEKNAESPDAGRVALLGSILKWLDCGIGNGALLNALERFRTGGKAGK